MSRLAAFELVMPGAACLAPRHAVAVSVCRIRAVVYVRLGATHNHKSSHQSNQSQSKSTSDHRPPAVTMAGQHHRLTFTVSGGLEGLAEAEVQCLLAKATADAVVGWKRRGNSGSQLEVCFLPSLQPDGGNKENLTDFVSAAMSSLRYVEYAYLEAMSTSVDHDGGDLPDLVQRIQQAVTSGVCLQRLNEILRIGRDCQNTLGEKDVGLEKLPGILLPTPNCTVDGSAGTKYRTPSSGRGFVVNTIYTKDEVAKVVVEGFIKLVHNNFGKDDDNMLFVDAGTGSGALLHNLPREFSIGVDTHPYCNDLQKNILKADFLKLTNEKLNKFAASCGSRYTEISRLCLISNPPFSERSRGDYSAIVRFINKAVDLGALCIGVIVPTKFARERVWASLGMDKRVRLLARFLLPNNSFFDPADGTSKNISSIFLFFGMRHDNSSVHIITNPPLKVNASEVIPGTIHVVSKRDKRMFSEMTTAVLSASIARGLEDAGAMLASSDVAEFSYRLKSNLLLKVVLIWSSICY